jgi:hypothetical protein
MENAPIALPVESANGKRLNVAIVIRVKKNTLQQVQHFVRRVVKQQVSSGTARKNSASNVQLAKFGEQKSRANGRIKVLVF